MNRTKLDASQPVAVTVTDGLQLSREETMVLNAVWGHAERVDWAVYERLRLRVLAWPSPASPGGARSEEVSGAEPVADDNTR